MSKLIKKSTVSEERAYSRWKKKMSKAGFSGDRKCEYSEEGKRHPWLGYDSFQALLRDEKLKEVSGFSVSDIIGEVREEKQAEQEEVKSKKKKVSKKKSSKKKKKVSKRKKKSSKKKKKVSKKK